MMRAGWRKAWIGLTWVALLPLLGGADCFNPTSDPPKNAGTLKARDLADPGRPAALGEGVTLRGARNEAVAFTFELDPAFAPADPKTPVSLRFVAPRKAGATGGSGAAATSMPLGVFGVYQVLPLPVDGHRAAVVRHHGQAAAGATQGRALLPLSLDAQGTLPLSALRKTAGGTGPLIWVDVRIPATAESGSYEARAELAVGDKALAWVPVALEVEDFILSEDRRLHVVARAEWEALARLFPSAFEGIDDPATLSRGDARCAAAIRVLDDLVNLAQAHRTSLYVPQVQPVVKFPAGRPPQADWSDFDSVVGPWLRGDAFPDGVPLGHWPLPAFDGIHLHAPSTQLEYWQAAAAHFEEQEWLARSAVELPRPGELRPDLLESLELSQRAAAILAAHPKVRVSLPCEEEQVHQASLANPKLIPTADLERVIYAAAGLVSAPPAQRLPEGAGIRSVRTDLPGLAPDVGPAAGERQTRLLAFLAFLRDARYVHMGEALPSRARANEPAPADELAWAYPGSWFGVEGVVPSLHLKWLRRAQQDYEYLHLARQRGQGELATSLARLVVKPVEVRVGAIADPADALLSGTTDPAAWAELLPMLSDVIRIAEPGRPVDPADQQRLRVRINNWRTAQERPLLLARSLDWTFGRGQGGRPVAGLRLGLDVYNAADQQPESNRLGWARTPEAFSAPAEPVEVPKLGPYRVDRFHLEATVDLDRVTPASRTPLRVAYTEGFSGRTHTLEALVPVAWCERRAGAPLKIDGSLADWQHEDALHEGPLVEMLGRPAVQAQAPRLAATPSAVYSCWTPGGGLYVGFKVQGIAPPSRRLVRNYVEYDLRRAWGEDVVELLVQPVYVDGAVGPLLHVACKTTGSVEASRRLNPKLNANPFQPFNAAILYGALLDDAAGVWRGEVAIPWEAFHDPQAPGRRGERPALLRFNFAQHRASTGQSASWAGPVDYARDDAFMGALHLRERQ